VGRDFTGGAAEEALRQAKSENLLANLNVQ